MRLKNRKVKKQKKNKPKQRRLPYGFTRRRIALLLGRSIGKLTGKNALSYCELYYAARDTHTPAWAGGARSCGCLWGPGADSGYHILYEPTLPVSVPDDASLSELVRGFEQSHHRAGKLRSEYQICGPRRS